MTITSTLSRLLPGNRLERLTDAELRARRAELVRRRDRRPATPVGDARSRWAAMREAQRQAVERAAANLARQLAAAEDVASVSPALAVAAMVAYSPDFADAVLAAIARHEHATERAAAVADEDAAAAGRAIERIDAELTGRQREATARAARIAALPGSERDPGPNACATCRHAGDWRRRPSDGLFACGFCADHA